MLLDNCVAVAILSGLNTKMSNHKHVSLQTKQFERQMSQASEEYGSTNWIIVYIE